MSRMNFLWNKFGMLTPPNDPTLTGEQLQIKTKLAEVRSKVSIIMNQELINQRHEPKTTLFKKRHIPIYELLEQEAANSLKRGPAFLNAKPNMLLRKQPSQRAKKDNRPIYELFPINISPEENEALLRKLFPGLRARSQNNKLL